MARVRSVVPPAPSLWQRWLLYVAARQARIARQESLDRLGLEALHPALAQFVALNLPTTSATKKPVPPARRGLRSKLAAR